MRDLKIDLQRKRGGEKNDDAKKYSQKDGCRTDCSGDDHFGGVCSDCFRCGTDGRRTRIYGDGKPVCAGGVEYAAAGSDGIYDES